MNTVDLRDRPIEPITHRGSRASSTRSEASRVAKERPRAHRRAELWWVACLSVGALAIMAHYFLPGTPLPLPYELIGDSALLAAVLGIRWKMGVMRQIELGSAYHRELAAIVESSNDAIIATDFDTTITSWNPAAERMFGYSAVEAVGRTPKSLLIPDDELASPAALQGSTDLSRRVRQGESLSGVAVRRWRKDGSPIDVSITISPICNASGSVIGGSTIARDITREREAARELEEAEARYRLLVEQVPVIIYNWGVAGDINNVTENYVNPQIESILGFGAKEWMAEPEFWNTRIHPEDREHVVAEVIRCMEEAAPFSMEYRMLAKDGHVVWLRDEAVVLARDEQGRASLFQGVQLDITAEKNAEDVVRRGAEEKAQLIQLLAHELFTPITSIQGAALTLSAVGERLGPEELSFLAVGVNQGARRLRRLVQNLDAAARLDRDTVTVLRRDVPLGEILTAALRDFEGSEVAHINLPIPADVATRGVVADLPLAAQALSAVIQNALDFSEGKPVDIKTLEDKRGVSIRVSDHGPGIAAELQDQLFELFTQGDSSDTRSHQGLGVGLFLGRRVMSLLGGGLEYSANPGGGASFTLLFVPSHFVNSPGLKGRDDLQRTRNPE